MKFLKTYKSVKKSKKESYSEYEKMVRKYLFNWISWKSEPKYKINSDKSVDVVCDLYYYRSRQRR